MSLIILKSVLWREGGGMGGEGLVQFGLVGWVGGGCLVLFLKAWINVF